MNRYTVLMDYVNFERRWIAYDTETDTDHSQHYTYESAFATCSVLNSQLECAIILTVSH